MLFLKTVIHKSHQAGLYEAIYNLDACRLTGSSAAHTDLLLGGPALCSQASHPLLLRG